MFEPGKPYPIDTLPDDLLDDSVPTKDKWALRTVLFWNDCQGWWADHAAEFVHCAWQENPVARFWSPCPPQPLTREEILAERGMVVCPKCDVAIDRADNQHVEDCAGRTWETST